MTANRPLRILRLIARLNVGGPARHVILLTEKFREKGWVSELVVGEVDASEGSMEDFAAAKGIVPVKFEKLGREISFLQDLPMIWRLFRYMVSFGPDIVHTHTAKAGAVGRVAALLYRRLHWRGLWAPRRVLVYHTFHGHVLSGYFSPLKSRIFRLLERGLAYISTNLITLSESLRDELVGFGVTRSEKMAVVSLGIELDAFLKTNES
ncbi:MAG: glycosyltransferase, partial [Nitrospinaceae bacterium]|nr:glycosyltransferase [Nitrospinaceae bacterium]